MSNAPQGTFAAVQSALMPEPLFEKRDSDGRRIAVTFASPQPGHANAAAADGWLVALDGSTNAIHGLALAMRLCRDSGARELDLVHVQPWLSKEATETELQRRGWAAAAEACAALDANGLGWRLHVLIGEPAERIVELAESLRSRGIVIGARGLSAFDGLLLGSVAQQVIHAARGAVLVVRAPIPPQERAPC